MFIEEAELIRKKGIQELWTTEFCHSRDRIGLYVMVKLVSSWRQGELLMRSVQEFIRLRRCPVATCMYVVVETDVYLYGRLLEKVMFML